ncbi:MAG: hypothetical protein E7360_05455 [Clostridiales bacterium]|nr:hypothetical protein [Clostridiales bacterium]
MYNNVRNDSLVKERTTNQEALRHENNIKKNWEQLMSFNKRQDVPVKQALKAYQSPSVKYVMNAFVEEAPVEDKVENVDLKPTSTTMQFEKSEQNDIYEEINAKRDLKEEKGYKINAKGKVLIAVYALVVVTIFSLIVLNSRMLRNLDNSIDNYSAQVQTLTEQRNEVYNELSEVMSDDVVIEKAVQMGMEKA